METFGTRVLFFFINLALMLGAYLLVGAGHYGFGRLLGFCGLLSAINMSGYIEKSVDAEAAR